MRRWLVIGVCVAAGIVVVTAVGLVALPAILNTPAMRSRIARAASRAVGRPVTFAAVSVAILPRPALRLNAVEVGEDPAFAATPFLTLDQLDVRLRLWPLLRGRLVLDSVVLQEPHITVVQHADGRISIASLGAAGASTVPVAAPPAGAGVEIPLTLHGTRVEIHDGVVLYFGAAADGSTSHYWIENLEVTIMGETPLRFEAAGRLQPGNLAVRLTDGTATLNTASRLGDAALRARLTLSSTDVADLLAASLGPVPAIDTEANGTLTLAGTVAAPSVSGALAFSNVTLTHTIPRCPEPRRRSLRFPALSVDAEWQSGQIVGRSLTTQFGDGTITGNLVIRLDEPFRIELEDLAVADVPLEALLVDFLCAGYAVTGPLDLNGALSYGAGGVVSFGDVRVGPGKVVGEQALASLATMVRVGGAVSALLSADLPWSLFSSPLDFDALTGSYEIGHGVLTVRDLLYVSSAMRISGRGTYVFDSDQVRFDLVVNHGRGEAYVSVTGTADDPSIHVTPSTILRAVHPGKIEQGLQDLFNRLR